MYENIKQTVVYNGAESVGSCVVEIKHDRNKNIWRASIIDSEGFIVFDDDNLVYIIAEGNTIEDALINLDKICE